MPSLNLAGWYSMRLTRSPLKMAALQRNSSLTDVSVIRAGRLAGGVQTIVYNIKNVLYVYYINTSEIPSELSRENFISSHVKITCYLHM